MKKRTLLSLATASAAGALLGAPLVSRAQSARPFRVGLILPMTGPFASTGKQIDAAVKLWVAQNGSTVAGREIEVILKDDGGAPDVTRRVAQELIVNDKASVLAGFGLTPLAFSAAPVATQARVPAIVMAAATSSITEASPFIVRTSYTLPQTSLAMAEWANKNGMKKFVSIVTDYGPGLDAEKFFNTYVKDNGGRVLDALRVPLRGNDFSPFLQKVHDAKPDALFVFVPSGAGTLLMKQFAERGLDKAGIRIIGDGGITDDDILQDMGDVALGAITAFHYSAAHPSATNRKFVQAFKAANKGMRPNFMAAGGYDGMHLIYEAIKATKGQGDGQALVAAMKGQIFESPRGQILIDAQTRDIVQDIYIRKVERIGGELQNVEFDVMKSVKDPGKART